ncbi:MAG TPA: hypothetical protein VJY35_05115 [Candidatus Eisenbacteria bacterium]|nr:hypothetical protein [Candidatus Eisenbacteria bacterium]
MLNAPLTLVSLPFRALGALSEAGLLRVQEDHLVPRVQYGLTYNRFGVGVGPGGLGDRTGLGAALRFEPPRLRGWLRASLAGSMSHYHRGRVELGRPWLFAGYTYDWRPQEPFFGLGPNTSEGDVSDFAMQSQRAELQLRLRAGTKLRHEVGAWVGERQSVLRSGRERTRPSIETAFPQLAAGALNVEQHHVVTGARAALDTRSGHPHWARGWRIGAQAERFGDARSNGLLFPDAGSSPGFNRFTLGCQAGWSFMRDPRTLRLGARVVDIRPFDPAQPPMPFDLSHLGGRAGLAGFETGRFHGLDLLVVNLGYIFPLTQYAELELATELGSVSDDLWHETRLDGLEHSYSVMFRPRSKTAPLGAIGVSWSREATRVRVSLGGVE